LVEETLRVWPGSWTTEADLDAPHEASLLHLATDKATQRLGWFPVWDFKETVRSAMEWYRLREGRKRTDMAAFSREQIANFVADARAQGLVWTESP
jgi:CDP-glucose 4,6-dehydratase